MGERFDAIIIGAGQGGTPLAIALAEAGMKTALIERADLGGTCVNTGCTPTKTLLASARAAHLARRLSAFGISAGEVQVDLRAVIERKRAVVSGFRDGTARHVGKVKGLELVRGSARFVEPRAVQVDGRSLGADKVFIDTGTRPANVDVRGIESVRTYDSTSIMEVDALPEHLFILGGGAVGVETAQMFRRFGSKVTIVERGVRLLDREDTDISDAIAEVLVGEGVDLLLGTTPIDVFPAANGGISLEIEGEGTLSASHLMVAAGRTPNTDALNLAAAGVKTDARGYVVVNDELETSAPGVWALGDVKGGPAFTHVSYDDFRILKTNLLGEGGASTKDRLVPYAVYTDPELGRIGMTETEARCAGRRVGVKRVAMGDVARAVEIGETHGVMKAVVDFETGEILGAAVLAPSGGEIMAMIQVAMLGKLPFTALRDGVFAHPTLAEGLNALFSISACDAAP